MSGNGVGTGTVVLTIHKVRSLQIPKVQAQEVSVYLGGDHILKNMIIIGAQFDIIIIHIF